MQPVIQNNIRDVKTVIFQEKEEKLPAFLYKNKQEKSLN